MDNLRSNHAKIWEKHLEVQELEEQMQRPWDGTKLIVSKDHQEQGLANYGLWARSSPLPVFVQPVS